MKPSARLKSALFFLICAVFNAPGQQRPIDREFLKAVQDRDVVKIESLLSQGANVNTKEGINGHFALQYAIDWPDARLVKLLIDKGANVNLADDSSSTALIDAARNSGAEYQAIVKLLLERGADVHAHSDEAIFGASKYGDAVVVKELLQRGAPANATNKNEDDETVLMAAASGGSVEKVELLIAAGANVGGTNALGQTALMKAVALDHRYNPAARLPMIELLLKKGADINGRDKAGRTPLLHSVVQYMSEAGGIISHPEVVELLLNRGADVQAKDADGNNALLITVGVWHGPIEIVRALLAKQIEVNAQNKNGVTALMVAADKGRRDLVDLLLQNGASTDLADVELSTALDHAVAGGYADIAKLLFNRRAHSRNVYPSEAALMAATTNFALQRAALNRNIDELKTQLGLGADVNSRGAHRYTALLYAVEYDYSGAEIVTLLLEKGADPNILNDDGESALMLAARRNNDEATTALLAHKAKLGLRNKQRQTALHIAAAGLHAAIVKALLSAQSESNVLEVDARDEHGRTPLLLAADNEGYVPDEVMQMLLAKGADVNARDNEGNTALMLSAKSGSMAGVEFLLKNKAVFDTKNKDGATALQLARKVHENKGIINADIVEARIVEMLVKAGAKE